MIETESDKRASLSYALGWTDAIAWAIGNPRELARIIHELDDDESPAMRSVTIQASDLYDEAGAEPLLWAEIVPRERLLRIRAR